MSRAFNEGGMATTRLTHADQQRRAERDATARLKLAAFALDQPDPQAWLTDQLDALGLLDRPHRDCAKPSPGTVARHKKAGQTLCGTCRPFAAGYERDYRARRTAS